MQRLRRGEKLVETKVKRKEVERDKGHEKENRRKTERCLQKTQKKTLKIEKRTYTETEKRKAEGKVIKKGILKQRHIEADDIEIHGKDREQQGAKGLKKVVAFKFEPEELGKETSKKSRARNENEDKNSDKRGGTKPGRQLGRQGGKFFMFFCLLDPPLCSPSIPIRFAVS